jgi:hypothetical protein
MKTKWMAAFNLTRALMLSGCMVEVLDEPLEQGDDELIVDDNARWPDRKSIPVCFTMGNGTSAREQAVRAKVEAEYAKVGLCFSGWGACSTSTPCPAIRLEISPNGDPGVAGWSYVGPARWMCNASNRTQPTMWLRTDQTDWAAVHEFAHAVGVHHEHARTDNDGRCGASRNESIPEGGSIHYIGDYDPSSVSNYCSGNSRLSANDVRDLKTFYNVGSDLSCSGGGDGDGDGDELVTLFQHCSYNGWQIDLAPGDYNLTQLRALGAVNDDASSLQVPPGYEVVLFEHDNFGGTSVRVTSDTSCLVGNGFNDRLSSMRIRRL